MAAAMLLSGCSGKNSSDFPSTEQDKKVVMTIGGEDVEYQEYRYFLLNNKRDQFGEDAALTEEDCETLKELVEANVKNRHTLTIMADEWGVKLTDDEEQAIDTYVKQYRASCGDDETYLLALEQQYMTHDLFYDLMAESQLAYSVLDYMKSTGMIATGDEAVDAALASDEIICIKEIYVEFLSAEAKDYAKGRAEEALAALKAGGDFVELMGEYSDYSEEYLSPEHGYYTMKYDALDEIWEAAIGLDEGEYSGVVESPYGYHIVLRCPKDEAYMNENADEIFENYTYSKFYEEFYKFYNNLTPVYTDYGKSLDLAAVE